MNAEDLGLDHFHIYQIRALDAGQIVGLQGQFDRRMGKAKLAFLDWFANPASKNREGIFDKNAHLTGYRLYTTEEPVRVVELENQFGRQKLVIGSGTHLLAPAKKRDLWSERLDHYKVYKVLSAEKSLGRTVELKDQFGAAKVVVTYPYGFAVPVKKKHESTFPIHNRETHLTLYGIRPVRGDKPVEPAVRPIKVGDQFGTRGIGSFRSFLLAVPSIKRAWKEI